ncbi:hypothetical protein RFI_22533, partial [Reticulomyxa filosa]
MASPNACGNVALLLSALKQEKVEYTPTGIIKVQIVYYCCCCCERIERALINTAMNIPTTETLGQGHGLMQVHKALDYCSKFKSVISSPVRYRINVTGGLQKKGRGIYIRDIIPAQVMRYSIGVTPQFPENYPNEKRLNFELKCALKTTSPYINPCEHLIIPSHGNSFQVVVKIPQDTDTDEPVIFTEIVGLDISNPEAGPVFRVPVVICVPLLTSKYVLERVGPYPREIRRPFCLATGKIDRKMYVVPEGCSHASL